MKQGLFGMKPMPAFGFVSTVAFEMRSYIFNITV
jgi:hypothetical protein